MAALADSPEIPPTWTSWTAGATVYRPHRQAAGSRVRPVIPDLGFPLGTRGQMFYLDPSRANCYAPRKRPRTTLTPSLALQGGRPWLVFGTPGGDGQDQWSLQVFLNIVEFGMDPARAVEAPTVTVQSFPSSFYPRQCFPLRVSCESRIKMETLKTLQQWGA